ncbi:MAG: helix-turn-helix domain-containing protein [Anaerolineae bacterium]|nr:helix-turn-helix domain-containing protein [Anaerolineae bacterium]
MPREKLTIDPNAVYSRREATEALGISLSTLKKLVDHGFLEVSRPPGMRRIFIQGSSILRMLEQTTVNMIDEERQAS